MPTEGARVEKEKSKGGLNAGVHQQSEAGKNSKKPETWEVANHFNEKLFLK
jgi:hypothetical protein